MWPVRREDSNVRAQAFVVVGDNNGHVGLGVKCAKEVATAIRGAIIQAKMSTVPVRRGYWGNKIGKPHTVPTKVRFSSLMIQRMHPQCLAVAVHHLL